MPMPAEAERDMVRDPDKWLRWPMLPLRRRDQPLDFERWDQLGFLTARSLNKETYEPPYTVQLGNMYGVPPPPPGVVTFCQIYNSLDDLLKDWEVD